MGCISSLFDPDPTSTAFRNAEINKQIELERKLKGKDLLVKLLLLGPSESGKSTVLKQITLIYGTGFTPEQAATYREAMHTNLLVAISTLIKAMDSLEIPYSFKKPESVEERTQRYSDLPKVPETVHVPKPNAPAWLKSSPIIAQIDEDSTGPASTPQQSSKSRPANGLARRSSSVRKLAAKKRRKRLDDPVIDLACREYAIAGGTRCQDGTIADLARYIASLDDPAFGFNIATALVPETISAIKQLWADSGVQYCFSRANEFQLVDSCAYIMENIDRVSDLNFVPTDDDILNARIMTHGIHESKFKAGKMSLVIYDVGGHRSERKKWAQFFEDAQAIIFIVAVSAYDQVCMEDEETSRMVEGFKLFDSICNHPLFTKTDMVLFLNKIDLFEEKIKVRPISLFFLDYRGPNEYKDSAKYFVKRFQNINKFPEDKKIYPHLTHATDTRQTKKILKSVLDSIQQSALKKMDKENF